MDAPTITVGGHTVTLAKPRVSAVLAMSRDNLSGMADGLYLGIATAAIVECWPKDKAWPILQRPRLWRVGRPIEEHGADAFDALVDGGVDFREVLTAGGVALNYALTATFSPQGVAAAEGNSEALAAVG